jgi:CheY-like chemotaxis protein
MPRTILIVDDNRDNLLVLRGLLEDIFPDVTVVEASDGVEAMDRAFRSSPISCFSTFLCPASTVRGSRAPEEQAETSGIPVVMLTAFGDQKDLRVRALEVGATGSLEAGRSLELTAQTKAMFRIRDACRPRRRRSTPRTRDHSCTKIS